MYIGVGYDQSPCNPIQKEIRCRCSGIRLILEQGEIDEDDLFPCFNFDKNHKSCKDHRQNSQCLKAQPTEGRTVCNENIQSQHSDDEDGKTCKIKLEGPGRFLLAFRCIFQKEHAQNSEDDREDKNPFPSKIRCDDAACKRCDARSTPGSYGPETQCSLSFFAFEIGFDQSDRRWHDACSRQPLNDAARNKERRPFSQNEAKRPYNAEHETNISNFLSACLVCKPPGSNNEHP